MNNTKRVLAAVALAGAALTMTGTAHAASTGLHSARSPLPPLPSPESLITEGITIEGPLINNLGLPQVI
ncbi:hypothetical protein ACIBBD_34535 [Streptomyces sp. NPDC051315]|uniref:hypothetical protein n=1 Tax=Streptomyces sp. NPDC051315 TaxID=3365650 RepID=UPI00378C567B